ncbi:MAG: hypothetical protein JWN88_952, partial [Frankiales bacterium]|nr:hypothetical protein [Frankiales bacterium]
CRPRSPHPSAALGRPPRDGTQAGPPRSLNGSALTGWLAPP